MPVRTYPERINCLNLGGTFQWRLIPEEVWREKQYCLLAFAPSWVHSVLTSLAFHYELDTNSSPGIFLAVSTCLGLLRHPVEVFCSKKLLESQLVRYQVVVVWLPNPYSISWSNKSFYMTHAFNWFYSSREPCQNTRCTPQTKSHFDLEDTPRQPNLDF